MWVSQTSISMKKSMSIKNNSVNNKADLIEICAEYCRENQMQPATVAGYFRILRIFIRDTGVDTVSGITPESIVSWRDSVMSRCTATTFNTYHRHVRAILNHCVRKKYLAENPILLIRQCRRVIVRRKACPREDVERLCRHLQADLGDPVSIFLLRGVATLYYTGIRLSQLAGLEWNDIDFDANTILLREKYSKTGVEWSIPLHEDLHEVLLLMQEEACRMFPDFRKTDQVFLLQCYSDRYQGNQQGPRKRFHSARSRIRAPAARPRSSSATWSSVSFGGGPNRPLRTGLIYLENNVPEDRSLTYNRLVVTGIAST